MHRMGDLLGDGLSGFIGQRERGNIAPIINRQTATNLINVVLIEFNINFSCCVALDIHTGTRIGILRRGIRIPRTNELFSD